MPEDIDKEVQAIKVILTALEPLKPEVRTSVLGYVIRRLQVAVEPGEERSALGPSGAKVIAPVPETETLKEQQSLPSHIKALKEKKKPRSANEMAALVAYYLAHLAPQKDRKDKITTKDINTYFKIAEFPLPTKTQFTLPNAKAAGYFDAVGSGEYKLNAVGYNLVAHSMPRGGDTSDVTLRTKRARRAALKR